MTQQVFNFGRRSFAKQKAETIPVITLPEIKYCETSNLSMSQYAPDTQTNLVFSKIKSLPLSYRPSRQQARNLITVDTNETNLIIEREINENENV